MIALKSVDLPEPLTPTSAVIVPVGTEKLAWRIAVMAVAIGDGHVFRTMPSATGFDACCPSSLRKAFHDGF
jgi:hypothetical protein